MRSWCWLCTALAATAACGGDLLGDTPDAGNDVPMRPGLDASLPRGSAPDAASSQDASGADAIGPVCGGSWSAVFDSLSNPNGSIQALMFSRMADFMDWARNVAVLNNFVDPTTGVTCTAVSSCPYDPTVPRVSPQDVHHSNALNEFIGPDNRSYVWTYYPPRNQWFLVDRAQSPQAYQWLVEYNAGCLPNCSCDAG